MNNVQEIRIEVVVPDDTGAIAFSYEFTREVLQSLWSGGFDVYAFSNYGPADGTCELSFSVSVEGALEETGVDAWAAWNLVLDRIFAVDDHGISRLLLSVDPVVR